MNPYKFNEAIELPVSSTPRQLQTTRSLILYAIVSMPGSALFQTQQHFNIRKTSPHLRTDGCSGTRIRFTSSASELTTPPVLSDGLSVTLIYKYMRAAEGILQEMLPTRTSFDHDQWCSQIAVSGEKLHESRFRLFRSERNDVSYVYAT